MRENESMKHYKVAILGSQCSGKSAIIQYLQENTDLYCIDHDEEIKRRHDGVYPSDHVYVSTEVLPKIEEYVLSLSQIVYSASFFGQGKDQEINHDKIDSARKQGLHFLNLVSDRAVLEERNRKRIEEGKDDASVSFDWYQKVYNDMDERGQFDTKIDTNGSVEEAAKQIISFIKQS